MLTTSFVSEEIAPVPRQEDHGHGHHLFLPRRGSKWGRSFPEEGVVWPWSPPFFPSGEVEGEDETDPHPLIPRQGDHGHGHHLFLSRRGSKWGRSFPEEGVVWPWSPPLSFQKKKMMEKVKQTLSICSQTRGPWPWPPPLPSQKRKQVGKDCFPNGDELPRRGRDVAMITTSFVSEEIAPVPRQGDHGHGHHPFLPRRGSK